MILNFNLGRCLFVGIRGGAREEILGFNCCQGADSEESEVNCTNHTLQIGLKIMNIIQLPGHPRERQLGLT